jgi:hypothetical protein
MKIKLSLIIKIILAAVIVSFACSCTNGANNGNGAKNQADEAAKRYAEENKLYTSCREADGIYYIECKTSKAKEFDSLEVLRLSDKELENIGVYRIEDYYAFLIEEEYDLKNNDKSYATALKYAGYAGYGKGILRKLATTEKQENDENRFLAAYGNWNMEKSLGDIPVQMSYSYSNDGGGCSGDHSLNSILRTVASDEISGFPDDARNEFFKLLKANRGDLSKYEKIVFRIDKKIIQSHGLFCVVPVLLQNYENSLKNNTLLFMPRTQAIVDRMPKRYNLTAMDGEINGIARYNKAMIDKDFKEIKKLIFSADVLAKR